MTPIERLKQVIEQRQNHLAFLKLDCEARAIKLDQLQIEVGEVKAEIVELEAAIATLEAAQ